ncbi:chemotaxis protein CheB [Pseudohaliea sp.]|uniref:chemotaxis protein CheB n=1 Tax=Pseudohaliea sp. TaxID=2740289 RepID=UPI0032EC585C
MTEKPSTDAAAGSGPHASTPASATQSSAAFRGYVVAIGASAGGLDALERLFSELPSASGAAYVVIQHLSPDHKSMMDNLLARHTAMPVTVAENGMSLLPDHVFLIPPGKNMTIAGDRLQLVPKSPHGLSLPIDLFFQSLSAEVSERAVGIILSGTGSDGTRGAVALNNAGGFLLAQDPESAKFDGMPRSVIATGLVDEVMPPEAIAARVTGHVTNHVKPSAKVAGSGGQQANPLEGILALLHEVGGVNFRDYKVATVQRRIERRMQLRHVADIENYLHLLRSDNSEVSTLRRDALIPVTSFFRDSKTFEALADRVIPEIVAAHSEHEPVRVWIAGCSTGEEAYSITILFLEAFDRLRRWPQLKVFATDVEQQYIDIASAGVYSEGIANEVSEERLERFFEHRGNQFVLRAPVRQHIVFARHNVLEDPPFTRMDLVSCRNTLIYFNARAQERALGRFQYALRKQSYLLLGSSESLGALDDNFRCLDSKHKLFQLRRTAPPPLDLGAPGTPRERPKRTGRAAVGANRESPLIEAARSALQAEYQPPALLVNRERELLHVFGNAQRFLQIPEGSTAWEITRLLTGRLSSIAAALLHKAVKEGVALRSDRVTVADRDGTTVTLHLCVNPVKSEPDGDAFFLLVVEETEAAGSAHQLVDSGDLDAAANERIQALERDLEATRDSLQATIEELETSNEELQATNEELMASNEELQSTNEELQSVNEELYTVNAENQEKIDILNRLNADLDNMTRAAMIPTLFVDVALTITRFTAEAQALFSIREGDIGRPLADFSHSLDYPELLEDLRQVIATAQLTSREVRARDGQWLLVRIHPYLEEARTISGAVITIIDTTQLKDAQRLQGTLDSLSEHIAVLDGEGTITMVNDAWRNFARANGDRDLKATGPGMNYLEACACLGNDSDDDNSAGEARAGIAAVLDEQRDSFTLRYPCHSPTERRWFVMHAAPVKGGGGAVVSHIDITHWVEEEPP